MAQVSGIIVERRYRKPLPIVSIDLNKHKDLIPLLEEKGVSIEAPLKWTAKMKKSFAEAKNGEYKEGSIQSFWS